MINTTIDTIKIHIQSGEEKYNEIRNRLKTVGRSWYDYRIKYREGSDKFTVRGKGYKKWFLKVNYKKVGFKRYTHINITIHLNRFIYETFRTQLVSPPNVISTLNYLIERLLGNGYMYSPHISIQEIHVAKDIILDFDTHYYLKLLALQEYKSYFVYPNFFQSTNYTLTVHSTKEESLIWESATKRLDQHTIKPEKKCIVYDKGRKLNWEGINKGLNLIRFEYEFKDNDRRKIGIKQGEVSVYNLLSIEWDKYLNNFVFNKFTSSLKNSSSNRMFSRNIESMREKYRVRPEEIDFNNYEFYCIDFVKEAAERVFLGMKIDKIKRNRKIRKKLLMQELYNKQIPTKYGVKGFELAQELHEKISDQSYDSIRYPNLYLKVLRAGESLNSYINAA